MFNEKLQTVIFLVAGLKGLVPNPHFNGGQGYFSGVNPQTGKKGYALDPYIFTDQEMAEAVCDQACTKNPDTLYQVFKTTKIMKATVSPPQSLPLS